MSKSRASIDDLAFALDWLECYDDDGDGGSNARAKANAIAFLSNEIDKRRRNNLRASLNRDARIG